MDSTAGVAQHNEWAAEAAATSNNKDDKYADHLAALDDQYADQLAAKRPACEYFSKRVK